MTQQNITITWYMHITM